MKKIHLLIICLLIYNIALAQVGIGTNVPKITLEVTGVSNDPYIPDGFIAPRLTGNELTEKNSQYTNDHHGAIVFVTQSVSATSGKTRNVKTIGYYFYDSAADGGLGLWISFAPEKQQFYIPSMLLPTDRYTLPSTSDYSFSNNIFNVNLFSIYKAQLNSPRAASSSSLLESAGNAADYHYFVLYYDASVFKNVAISMAGMLSYSLVSGYLLSEKTFMNIVILEK